MKVPTRARAAAIVANNWRIQKRLPRLTALAARLGLLTEATKK